MAKPLYELAAEHRALLDVIDDGGVVDDMRLEALSGAIEQKGAGIVHVLRQLDADEEALKVEIDRLTTRKRVLCANRERLRSYVKRTMLDNQVTRIKAGTFSISVSEAGQCVVIDDEARVPDTFMRVKKEPNKTAILEAFTSTGECVPGTHVERSVALRIR